MNVDWRSLFLPDTPLLEIFIRGTVMYLALFLLLRLVLKRETGMVGIADLVVVVLLADAAQNGLSGDYNSITDGLLLISTIIFWSYFLDWLGYRFPRFQHLLRPSALMLVKDGQMLKNNMRKEFITEEELRSTIRTQGVDDLNNVKAAFIEGDGVISVITRDASQHTESRKKGV